MVILSQVGINSSLRRSLWLDLQIWLLSWANTLFGRWGAEHANR